MRWFGWLGQDIRYGLRTLWKGRRFAAVAILALALGIGATTVIFSVIDGILIEPFPYRNADRYVAFLIHDVTKPKETGRIGLRIPEFTDLREQNHVFEDVVGFSGLDVLYTHNGEAERFSGCWVTDNISSFLGMKPLLGRPLSPEDAAPDAPPVFGMTDELWAKEFHRDPKIVGTVMTMNNIRRTLVEILPPRYVLSGCDIWIPVYTGHTDVRNTETGGFPLYLIANEHLKPGVSMETAKADVEVIARRLSVAYPQNYPKQFTVQMTTVANYVAGDFRGMLYALMAAVFMLLLISCSNIANLLLSQATAREKEIAIRTALGASRGRLIRQLLVESFLLSVAGCIVGCFFAYFGLKELVAKLPNGYLTPSVVITLNYKVLLFALGIAVLTTFLCGLAPAIHTIRGALQTQLSGTGRGMSVSYRHGKLRAGLVIGEVALSILLLAGAGLMTRSLLALEHVDLGFNPSNVLVVRMALATGRYDTADQKRRFIEQVLQRVRALPGVKAATMTISVPPFGGGDSRDVTIPGKTHADAWQAEFELCDEDYFKTLGIPLVRGRLLSQEDIDSVRAVAVINQTLAARYFRDEDPIGKSIKLNDLDQIPGIKPDTYYQIIGIVGDIRNQGLRESALPGVFLPFSITGGGSSRGLLVRTATNPLSMLPTISKEIWAVDSNVALPDTGTLEGFLKSYGYATPRFGLIALGTFAGIGLALVIIGVFSVMAYSVSLQTHDIGVRMALGAQQTSILWMVLNKGMRLIVAGIFVGVVASFALTRFLASQLWGVSATDPWTFAAVAAVILVVGLAACILPARSAARVDPMIALRYE